MDANRFIELFLNFFWECAGNSWLPGVKMHIFLKYKYCTKNSQRGAGQMCLGKILASVQPRRHKVIVKNRVGGAWHRGLL